MTNTRVYHFSKKILHIKALVLYIITIKKIKITNKVSETSAYDKVAKSGKTTNFASPKIYLWGQILATCSFKTLYKITKPKGIIEAMCIQFGVDFFSTNL